MAGIGEASAIIAIAQLGIGLSHTLIAFIGEVKDASSHIARIGNEIQTTSERLKEIGGLVANNPQTKLFSDEGIQSAERCSNGCSSILSQVGTIISKGGWKSGPAALDKHDIDISLFSSFRWPFLKSKLESPRAELQIIKADLNLLFTSAMATKSLNPTTNEYALDIPRLARTREWAARKAEAARERARESQRERPRPPRRGTQWSDDDPELFQAFVAYEQQKEKEKEKQRIQERVVYLQAEQEKNRKEEEEARQEIERNAVDDCKREQEHVKARGIEMEEQLKKELTKLGFEPDQINSIVAIPNFNVRDTHGFKNTGPNPDVQEALSGDIAQEKGASSALGRPKEARRLFSWFRTRTPQQNEYNPHVSPETPVDTELLASKIGLGEATNLELWLFDVSARQKTELAASDDWMIAKLKKIEKDYDLLQSFAQLQPLWRSAIQDLLNARNQNEDSRRLWKLIYIGLPRRIPKASLFGHRRGAHLVQVILSKEADNLTRFIPPRERSTPRPIEGTYEVIVWTEMKETNRATLRGTTIIPKLMVASAAMTELGYSFEENFLYPVKGTDEPHWKIPRPLTLKQINDLTLLTTLKMDNGQVPWVAQRPFYYTIIESVHTNHPTGPDKGDNLDFTLPKVNDLNNRERFVPLHERLSARSSSMPTKTDPDVFDDIEKLVIGLLRLRLQKDFLQPADYQQIDHITQQVSTLQRELAVRSEIINSGDDLKQKASPKLRGWDDPGRDRVSSLELQRVNYSGRYRPTQPNVSTMTEEIFIPRDSLNRPVAGYSDERIPYKDRDYESTPPRPSVRPYEEQDTRHRRYDRSPRRLSVSGKDDVEKVMAGRDRRRGSWNYDHDYDFTDESIPKGDELMIVSQGERGKRKLKDADTEVVARTVEREPYVEERIIIHHHHKPRKQDSLYDATRPGKGITHLSDPVEGKQLVLPRPRARFSSRDYIDEGIRVHGFNHPPLSTQDTARLDSVGEDLVPLTKTISQSSNEPPRRISSAFRSQYRSRGQSYSEYGRQPSLKYPIKTRRTVGSVSGRGWAPLAKEKAYQNDPEQDSSEDEPPMSSRLKPPSVEPPRSDEELISRTLKRFTTFKGDETTASAGFAYIPVINRTFTQSPKASPNNTDGEEPNVLTPEEKHESEDMLTRSSDRKGRTDSTTPNYVILSLHAQTRNPKVVAEEENNVPESPAPSSPKKANAQAGSQPEAAGDTESPQATENDNFPKQIQSQSEVKPKTKISTMEDKTSQQAVGYPANSTSDIENTLGSLASPKKSNANRGGQIDKGRKATVEDVIPEKLVVSRSFE